MTASSLELAVLGLLKEGPMHGYQLSKRLSVTLGPLYRVSYGSLYPCLKRLRKAAFVQEGPVSGKPRRKRKGEELPQRARATLRGRKVYEITGDGERFFFDQLERGAVYDTDEGRFQTRFAFFRYLPEEVRIRALEHRKAYLEEKLAEFKQSLLATAERMDAYSKSLIDHGVETTEGDIRWLEGLIDRERAATGGRGASTGLPSGEPGVRTRRRARKS